MRIGVNSGQVVAGNMGTRTLFNFTIMGDTVNLGARLESANKFYGTNIMIGESTFALAGDRFHTRRLDQIRVKGKNKPVAVYELLGPRGTLQAAAADRFALYESALEAYTNRSFTESIRILECILSCGKDRPSEVLLERCREYLEHPPEDDWDGVYTMKTK
jgi:adenylate cyclase